MRRVCHSFSKSSSVNQVLCRSVSSSRFGATAPIIIPGFRNSFSADGLTGTNPMCNCSFCSLSFKPPLQPNSRSFHRGKSTHASDIIEAAQEDTPIDGILRNNVKWVDTMKDQDSQYFDKLGKGQRPQFLYFGCSDSRVPANEIMGLG